ncbi:MAG: hypothetical protein SVU32_02295 [Candidatus Nanohaloarchaea archaeon]|nr:hypothetical protein [Candidatus Nanohaloarchaea archaeon]
MNPGKVLEGLDGKDVVSPIEAERGLLAALLQAARDQAETDPSPITEVFGTDLDWTRIDRAITAEFKDMVYKFRNEADRLDGGVLEDAVGEMDDRVGVEDWSTQVQETYEERKDMILEKCTAGGTA